MVILPLAAPVPEGVPRIGKFVCDVEETPTAAHLTLRDLVGGAPEHLATFTRGIVKIQDHVTQRVHIEEVVLTRKLDAPAANGPEKLERQVPLVSETELEHAPIALTAGRGDRLTGRIVP